MQHTQPRKDLTFWPKSIGPALWLFSVLLLYVQNESGGIIINYPDLSALSSLTMRRLKQALQRLKTCGYITIEHLDFYIRIVIVEWGRKQVFDPELCLYGRYKASPEFYTSTG